MVRLFILSLFVLFSVSLGQQVPITSRTETSVKTISIPANNLAYPAIMAAKNDLIAFYDPGLNHTVVLKRNTTGQYEQMAVHNNPTTGTFDYTATDGQWIAHSSLLIYEDETEELYCQFFVPNEDGTISNLQELDKHAVTFRYGDFLADGSFVGVAANNLYTYQYINTNWTLVDTFNFTVRMRMPYTGGPLTMPYFQFINNTVVAVTKNYKEIHFYERQGNTWSLTNVIASPLVRIGAAAWNGVDTVVASAVDDGLRSYGTMSVFTLIDGEWSQASTLTGRDLDVFYLGARIIPVDADTFLLNADDRALLLQRHNGEWSLNGDFTGDTALHFIGLGYNAYDLFISVPNGIYTVPLCTVKPIEFTCNKATALESCDFDAFDASVVCQYNAQCGDVSTTVNQFGIDSSLTHHVQFELHRFGAFPSRGNATFSCPAVSTPSTGNNNGNPTTVPVGGVATSSARSLITCPWLVGLVLFVIL